MRHATMLLGACLALVSGQAISAEPTLDWLAGRAQASGYATTLSEVPTEVPVADEQV